MRQLIKSVVQSSLKSLGYEMRCTRYIPQTMLDTSLAVELNFRHVVTELMHRCNRTQLIFMQIGAFDGVSCDPLREFVLKYNWQGVLVEPQPSAFSKLLTNYEACAGLIFKNCAVAKTSGQVDLFVVQGDDLPAWCGGLAGFSRESIEKHEPFAPGISQRIVALKVPTVPFNDLLCALPAPLDLLQTDTEGFDAELLDMFPFETHRPKLIHFERKHLSAQILDSCLQKLARFGYRFAFDGPEDMLAILEE